MAFFDPLVDFTGAGFEICDVGTAEAGGVGFAEDAGEAEGSAGSGEILVAEGALVFGGFGVLVVELHVVRPGVGEVEMAVGEGSGFGEEALGGAGIFGAEGLLDPLEVGLGFVVVPISSSAEAAFGHGAEMEAAEGADGVLVGEELAEASRSCRIS